MAAAAEGDIFVGEKANELRGILKLKYPTTHGIITDWADMQQIWQHAYSNLNVVQDQHPVLLTEAPLNPRSNRYVCCAFIKKPISLLLCVYIVCT